MSTYLEYRSEDAILLGHLLVRDRIEHLAVECLHNKKYKLLVRWGSTFNFDVRDKLQ